MNKKTQVGTMEKELGQVRAAGEEAGRWTGPKRLLNCGSVGKGKEDEGSGTFK